MDTPERIIVCDCDGCLTDGRLNIDLMGEKMFKSFHTRDVRAIRELVSCGFEFHIVTADDWEGGQAFAEKVGAGFLYLREKGKIRDYIGNEPFIAIGDDSWDIPMLRLASKAFVPMDGLPFSPYDLSFTRLKTKGGQGVIAELAYTLLHAEKKIL